MKLKIFLWLLTATFAATLTLRAENAAKLLQQTRDVYANANYLSMDIDAKVFLSADDKTGTSLGKALVRKSKDNYYSSFQGSEVIVNKKCCLLIDHNDKTVIYSDAGSLKNKNQMPVMLDSILGPNDSLLYRGVSEGQRHFSIYMKNSYICQAEIYVDDKTFLIKQITYFYRELDGDGNVSAYKVELDYSKTSLSAPAKNWFDESKYIEFHNGTPTLLPAWSKYQLTINEEQ